MVVVEVGPEVALDGRLDVGREGEPVGVVLSPI